MQLNNKQQEELHGLFLEAIPTIEEWQRIMLYKMSINLNKVAKIGNLSDVVFQIIEWANAADELEHLVRGVVKTNPHHSRLKQFARELGIVIIGDTIPPQSLRIDVDKRWVLYTKLQGLINTDVRLQKLCVILGIPYNSLNGSDLGTKQQNLMNKLLTPDQLANLDRALEREEEEQNKENHLKAKEQFKLGQKYYEKKQYPQAIAAFSQTIALSPYYGVAYFYRGRAYFDQHQYHKAKTDFDRAIQLRHDVADNYFYRGLACAALNQHKEAQADFTRVIEINAKHIRALYHRGLVRYALHLYRQACEDYTQALKLNPRYALAYQARSLAYYQQHRHYEAYLDYMQSLRVDLRLAHQRTPAAPAAPVAPAPRQAHLEVRGTVIPLPDKDEIVIGLLDPVGSPDKVVPDIDLTQYVTLDDGVSRNHAMILRQKNRYLIKDPHSTNRTFLNGQRIERTETVPLTDGCELRFGKLQAVFRIKGQ